MRVSPEFNRPTLNMDCTILKVGVLDRINRKQARTHFCDFRLLTKCEQWPHTLTDTNSPAKWTVLSNCEPKIRSFLLKLPLLVFS